MQEENEFWNQKITEIKEGIDEVIIEIINSIIVQKQKF